MPSTIFSITGAGLPDVAACARADVLLLLESFGSDIFLADVFRIAGSNVHGDVVHQLFEVVSTSNKVALAIDFNQYADLAPGMYVAGHRTLAGGAGRLFRGNGYAPLAQQNNRLLQIALRFGQSAFAIHHGRAGLVAKIFHRGGGNINGRSAH